MTAQVNSVSDDGGFLGGAVGVGDIIQGTYTYESTTPDTNPLSTVGDYWHTTVPSGITLEVNGLTFRTDPGDVDFLVEICSNHASRDNYLLRSHKNIFDVSVPVDPLYSSWQLENPISWQLDDPTMAALSSEALPVVPPVLSDWQSWFGLTISRYNYSTGDRFMIRADVTDAVLASAAVPEPGTFLLAGVGIMSLLCWRRR